VPVHGKAPIGTRTLAGPVDARAAPSLGSTDHHQGTVASLKPGQTPCPGRHLIILTVLKRSVALWVNEAMGR
jgi:hypothetical protein